jgi:hypothetical protein
MVANDVRRCFASAFNSARCPLPSVIVSRSAFISYSLRSVLKAHHFDAFIIIMMSLSQCVNLEDASRIEEVPNATATEDEPFTLTS